MPTLSSFHSGDTVQTLHFIRTQPVDIPAGSRGEVQYLTWDMNHRLMCAVQWQDKHISVVYPEEIQLLTQEVVLHD